MPSIAGNDIKRVVVACEAGMGSSVLLTTQLAQKLGPHGVEVSHSPVNALTDETADVVLLSDNLARLDAALRLSRKATREVRQNLTFAVGAETFLVRTSCPRTSRASSTCPGRIPSRSRNALGIVICPFSDTVVFIPERYGFIH